MPYDNEFQKGNMIKFNMITFSILFYHIQCSKYIIKSMKKIKKIADNNT